MVIRELYRQMQEIMASNQNSDAAFEATCLIEFVTGKKRIDVMNDEADTQTEQKLMEYAHRRKEGYPLQYILGRWQFFDMELAVGEGVLVPRQDTETVCEAAFEVIRELGQPAVLDLCSGSGCIALAIKKFCPDAQVVAIEKSDEAFGYLKKNIELTGLQVLPVQGDVFKYDRHIEKESFDIIISNPPYIDPAVKPDLQTEVGFEPEMALFADDKGLEFYKFIAHYYRNILRSKGYLIFEYGYDQQKQVKNILTEEGYTIIKEITDLGGNPRGVVARKTDNLP